MDENASQTVRIVFPANLRVGYCQIPAAEYDPAVHTLWKAEPAPASIDLGTDSGDQFSDDQLRDIIETETGKRPHHKTGRDKLVATFNELNLA